jgi:hypothetical protein
MASGAGARGVGAALGTTLVTTRGPPQPALGSAQVPGPENALASGSGAALPTCADSLATSSGLKRLRVLELVFVQAPPAHGSRSEATAHGPPTATFAARTAGAENSSATARAIALRNKTGVWTVTGGSLPRISCRK